MDLVFNIVDVRWRIVAYFHRFCRHGAVVRQAIHKCVTTIAYILRRRKHVG